MNVKNTFSDFELSFVGNPGVPNVLIFTEHVNATYYISFDIPLKSLHQKGEVNFAVASQNFMVEKGLDILERWHAEFAPDVVIITRYALPFGKEILDFFKLRKIPVVYHIDDDLLYIPDSLGEEIQKRQGAIEVVNSRKYLLQNCDLIYASTQHLASSLQQRFPSQKIFVGIYASYREGLSANAKRADENGALTIGYMGSKGHQNDLALVEGALVQLMHEFPNLRFEVFGTIKMPEKLEQFSGRIKSHRVNKNYFEFIEYLASLNWDIGLAPLEDVEFNHCKAPTKYIEYTSVGIPVIASNIAVYGNSSAEGGIILSDCDNWYNAIKSLIENENQRSFLIETSRSFCSVKYSARVLEAQVQQLINRMI